jgi:hypothetical protein
LPEESYSIDSDNRIITFYDLDCDVVIKVETGEQSEEVEENSD